MENRSTLEKTLDTLGIQEKENKLAQLMSYMKGILDWNKKINLTNITEEKEFIEKHYIDSLSICTEKEFIHSEKIIDIGTGGGFPGVPLAICYPEKEFILVDSLKKRLDVIDRLCCENNILNVKTIHCRAEELGQDADYRGKFDLCVSRAVADLSVLSELCIPLVRLKGNFISYKGPNLEKELESSEKAIEILGGNVERIIEKEFSKIKHKLVIIKKIKNTDAKYPRKSGIPNKKPLK